MINLRKTTSNKLFISRDGATADEECKPWGVSVFDNSVKISSLTDSGSVYEDHFSDFRVDGVPFASLSECLEYIEPCLGFNTAPGGSGADDEITTAIFSRILGTDGEFTWGASLNPVEIPEVPEGKLLDPIDCTMKFVRGTGTIDIPVWAGGNTAMDKMAYCNVSGGHTIKVDFRAMAGWCSAPQGTVSIHKFSFGASTIPKEWGEGLELGYLTNGNTFLWELWQPAIGTTTDNVCEITVRYRLIDDL